MKNKQKKYVNKFVLLYFIISLSFLSFIGGIITTSNNTFVFKWIYGSFLQIKNLIDNNNIVFESEFKILNDFEELILFTQDSSEKIFLLEKNGIKHYWDLSNVSKVITTNNDFISRPYGLHLFNNGDLIVSSDWTDKNTGISFLAKIDKNSNIIWLKEYPVHHWFSADEDFFYFTDRKLIDYEIVKNNYSKINLNYFNCKKDTINEEPVRIEDIVIADNKTGEIIKTIDLFKIIINNEDLSDQIIDCIDPFHVNDVRVIKNSFKINNVNILKGDLMVSLRNMNTIVILDNETNKVKWHLCCKFFMQHSPRLNNDKSIIIFDNLGGNSYSRVVEIDLVTKKIEGVFFGKVNNFGIRELFYSDSRGHLDLKENNILVSSSNQNLIFNLFCPNKTVSLGCEMKELIKTNSGVTFSKYYNHKDLNFLN